MSMRPTVCPKCNCSRTTVLKEHNPETWDLNMAVTLRCDNPMCNHEWEGEQMSHHTREQIFRGGLRV